ncbi:hypothetical protein ACFLRF_00580 [Candidatus Altiarchaeota archaeon]
MMGYCVYFPAFLVAFAVTFVCTRILIKKLAKAGICGMDGHKLSGPMVPEMGGTAILIGYTLAITVGFAFGVYHGIPLDGTALAACLGAFLIAGYVGAVDDIKKLHHRKKPVYLLAAALPLILLQAGVAEVKLPFFTLDLTNIFGLNLAILYWLIIIPLGITGSGNLVNMLAGFNGLMSGLAIISCLTMALFAGWIGNPTAVLIFTAMVGAQLAFLHFNKYPARIFPGDVGTLSFGAMYTAGIVIGNMEVVGLLAFLVYFGNASISLLSVGRFFEEKQFRKEKMSALVLGQDGTIMFNRLEKPITLCKTLLYNRPQTEATLVFKVLLLSIISSLIALTSIWWYT